MSERFIPYHPTLEEWEQQKIDGHFAVLDAREKFEYGPLLDRLRNSPYVTVAERKLAADIIDGTFKRPANRVAKGATEFMGQFVALQARVLADKGLNRKSAVDQLLERPDLKKRKIGKPTIEKAITTHRDTMHPSWQRQKTQK